MYICDNAIIYCLYYSICTMYYMTMCIYYIWLLGTFDNDIPILEILLVIDKRLVEKSLLKLKNNKKIAVELNGKIISKSIIITPSVNKVSKY